MERFPQTEVRASKLALIAAALVLLGSACAQTPSYQPAQQPWSELTDEERAQIRAVVRTFNDVKEKTPEEIRAIEPLVINAMDLGNDVILPFPETQFTLVTPAQCPDDCPEPHYVGARTLTLGGRVLQEPVASCEWGMQSAATHEEVDQEAFIRWLEEFKKTLD